MVKSIWELTGLKDTRVGTLQPAVLSSFVRTGTMFEDDALRQISASQMKDSEMRTGHLLRGHTKVSSLHRHLCLCSNLYKNS